MVVLALMVSGVTGCGDGPISPASHDRPAPPPTLLVSCEAAPGLHCSANLAGEGDVTSAASWSAADSFQLAGDVPVTPSSAVEFPLPGIPRVLRSRNVYIRADYVSPRWGHMRDYAPHAYAAEPSGAAVPLAYLSGDTSPAGVTVEIIDGEGAGRRGVSREDNGFYMIEFLRLNRPFTARASKPGYSSVTKAHPGIVDDALGYPSDNTLHFTLSPLPPS